METLRSLAECAEAIAALDAERQQIPRAITELENTIQAGHDSVAAERADLEEAERIRRSKEGELQEVEAVRQKHQSQTALVKTNEEYSALLREIDRETTRIGEVEEAILQAMEDGERLTVSVEASEKSQREMEIGLTAQIAERRGRLVEVEKELEVRNGEHELLVVRLDPISRSTYERISGATGKGTTRINGRNCAECHRDIPLETVNRVTSGELHGCPHCQKLLVLAEG